MAFLFSYDDVKTIPWKFLLIRILSAVNSRGYLPGVVYNL